MITQDIPYILGPKDYNNIRNYFSFRLEEELSAYFGEYLVTILIRYGILLYRANSTARIFVKI